jgi:hypothetical protein
MIQLGLTVTPNDIRADEFVGLAHLNRARVEKERRDADFDRLKQVSRQARTV